MCIVDVASLICLVRRSLQTPEDGGELRDKMKLFVPGDLGEQGMLRIDRGWTQREGEGLDCKPRRRLGSASGLTHMRFEFAWRDRAQSSFEQVPPMSRGP